MPQEPTQAIDESRDPQNPISFRLTDWLVLAVLVLLAIPVSISLGLQPQMPPWLSTTHDPLYAPIEVFGFFTALIFGLFAFFKLKGKRFCWQSAVVVGLPCLMVLQFATFNTEFSVGRSNDYADYTNAVNLVLQNKNPYVPPENLERGYLYPPFFAESMARVKAYFLDKGYDDRIAGNETFAIHQFLMLLNLWLCYALCFWVIRRLGFTQVQTAIFVTLFFALNGIITRNFAFNQVNVCLLNLCLIATLFARRYPILAGLSGALGIHLKLFPVEVVIPLVIQKRFAAIAWMVIGFVAILGLSTRGFQVWDFWIDYRSVLGQFPTSNEFRDNAIQRVFSLLHFGDIAQYLARGVGLAAAGWISFRIFQRTRDFKNVQIYNVFGKEIPSSTWITFANAADAILLELLVAPMVWEYHYVLAIPIALIVLATRGVAPARITLLAYGLLFAPPIFDVALFGFHRLAGLILVLWLTQPQRLLANNALQTDHLGLQPAASSS